MTAPDVTVSDVARPGPALLEAEGVVKTYGGLAAVNGLSFRG